jgi:hypothetical protein|tara:strand:- start:225 stop:515 length:291 start_codon:yes stop_codon:yes gene_type:complete
MVLRAVRDMHMHGARMTTAPSLEEHLDAIVWLGSTHAAVWFDVADVSQFNVLWDNDWMRYAGAALDGDEIDTEERQLLQVGVKVFGDLKVRYNNGS